MSKPNSIYVWDNVDNIIQRIESQIDFKSHTTDLFYSNTTQNNMKTVYFNLKIVF